MKEVFFILLVILALTGLTAFKYRKQIAHLLGFARMLKEMKQNMAQGNSELSSANEKGAALVNCSTCAVWVPQTRARRKGDLFYCSDRCLLSRAAK
jgi:hypothetical protein